MTIEVGKSYQTRDGRKATVVASLPSEWFDYQWLGYIGSTVCQWAQDGAYYHHRQHETDLISEWSDPTPFEKAKEAWRNGAIGGVEEFYWNAALGFAACCLDKIRMSGTHTGTAMEMVMHSVADEIRKAKV